MKLGTITAALVMASAASSLLAQNTNPTEQTTEQTAFGEERPIQHEVLISPKVLKLLLQTTAAKQGLEFASVKGEDPAGMFRAAEIHLRNSTEKDLIVLGRGWMTGADNDWFWVVRSADKNPRVVLFIGGSSVEFKNSKTNGLRDIVSHHYLASDTNESGYHFNGKRYVRWKSHWTGSYTPPSATP